MFKKKKQKPAYNGITFDSTEEIEFYQWCEEAKNAGLILDFVYQPEKYILSNKRVELTGELILNPHVYTADFQIYRSSGVFDSVLKKSFIGSSVQFFMIDIKGFASLYDDGRTFKINQKWMYDKYGVYVNKVIPEEFFNETWVPVQARYTAKTKKEKKKYLKFRSINDFLNAQ